MQFKTEYLFCTQKLIDPLEEVQEIYFVIKSIPWTQEKLIVKAGNGREMAWQEAYNYLFTQRFGKLTGWQAAPVLCKKPMHKGDFLKNGVFFEIQFGNSATIYRDYYKFHYGFANKLLALAVLIVPVNPVEFFPQRNPNSIINMASFSYAYDHMSALPIPVPVLLIGLTRMLHKKMAFCG